MWERAASTDAGAVGRGTFWRTMSDARTLEAAKTRPHAHAPSLPRTEVGVLIISISTKTIVDRLLFFRNKNLLSLINIFGRYQFGRDTDTKPKKMLSFSDGALPGRVDGRWLRSPEAEVQVTFTRSLKCVSGSLRQ